MAPPPEPSASDAAGDNGCRGHLLVAIPFAEPTVVMGRIRKRHPELKITFKQTKLGLGRQVQQVPADVWRDVTILCTYTDLPLSLETAPSLEFVHLISAGSDHAQNLPFYTNTDVILTTSTGTHAPVIAEWVLMTLLVASHRYGILHQWQQEKLWDDSSEAKAKFGGVSDNVGKRMGILGYGSIGRQVARSAQALGMDIVVFTANPRHTAESKKDHGFIVPGVGDPEGEIPSAWFSGLGDVKNENDRESLHRFLAQDLDYLLISLPLTERTRRLLGKKEFEILSKRNAFISNVARGEIIVQEDLIEALHDYERSNGERGLKGAAVDVADPDPLPADHPLWKAPNIIITPHMSAINKDYATRSLEVLEQNLIRRAEGSRLLNVVDRAKGYAPKI